jgi:uncharacterized protein (DUF924 family)
MTCCSPDGDPWQVVGKRSSHSDILHRQSTCFSISLKSYHCIHIGNSAIAAPLFNDEVFSMLFDSKMHTRVNAHVAAPETVARFWKPLGHAVWFGKDPAFDRQFGALFAEEHDAAARGELMAWLAAPEGALSLVILLDQYPRNAFRGTQRMYATDQLARVVAGTALHLGHHKAVDPEQRGFFYLPFGHSERLADQEKSVDLCADLPEPAPSHSRRHRDIIARFGRFPHRNRILGRESTDEEVSWLAAGGFAG